MGEYGLQDIYLREAKRRCEQIGRKAHIVSSIVERSYTSNLSPRAKKQYSSQLSDFVDAAENEATIPRLDTSVNDIDLRIVAPRDTDWREQQVEKQQYLVTAINDLAYIEAAGNLYEDSFPVDEELEEFAQPQEATGWEEAYVPHDVAQFTDWSEQDEHITVDDDATSPNLRLPPTYRVD